MTDLDALAMSLRPTRYCKTCGLGPREWMECEEPDCVIETQAEANARAQAAISKEREHG